MTIRQRLFRPVALMPVVALLVALPVVQAPPAVAQQRQAEQPAQADVAWAKETLKALGFDAGRADATVTELFTRRLREYQAARGLAQSGRLDQATVARLLQDRPQRQTQGTITFNSQGLVQTPEQQRAGAAPPAAPPQPRAAPQVKVDAGQSTADLNATASVHRGSPGPQAGTAPGPSLADVARRSGSPGQQPPSATARAAGDPRLDNLFRPDAAPRETVETGARQAGVQAPDGSSLGVGGFQAPAWTGWGILGLLIAFLGGFGMFWWKSGKREPGRFQTATAALAERREPSFAAPGRLGPTLTASRPQR